MKPAKDLLPLETIALEELTDADVDFIVHAANAYLLCVSEVKQLLKMVGLIPAKSAAQAATIEAVIERGETLLRELGEEE